MGVGLHSRYKAGVFELLSLGYGCDTVCRDLECRNCSYLGSDVSPADPAYDPTDYVYYHSPKTSGRLLGHCGTASESVACVRTLIVGSIATLEGCELHLQLIVLQF